MKHKLTLLVVLLTTMVLPALAQPKPKLFKNPDEATWAIKGLMQSIQTKTADGSKDSTEYKLRNPEGSKKEGGYISFPREGQPHDGNPSEKEKDYDGSRGKKEQVVFSLHDVETNRRNGFNDTMIFWSWVPEAGEWQMDVESGQGYSMYEIDSIMNIMLLLDCSGSMENKIDTLKEEAKYFLHRMLVASRGRGNVHVGIIGFSTIEYSKSHTYTPVSLTDRTYGKLCSIIDNLTAGGGTALYYSANAAVHQLQEDYSQNIRTKPGEDSLYAGATIIAFTDGHDNTSTDVEGEQDFLHCYNCYNSVNYYNHTQTWFPRQEVKKRRIQSFCIGMKGEDVTSNNVWRATEEKMRSVFGKGGYTPINYMGQLHSEFDIIIKKLTERHTILKLHVARGITGKVGWTFPEESPRRKCNAWLALCLEAGYGYIPNESDITNWGAALRLDCAFPITDGFALGLTGSLGVTKDMDALYRIGLLGKFNLTNGSAPLVGFGLQNWSTNKYPVYLTLGWKFKSPWYINATVNSLGESFCIGVGYSILGGRKK